MGPAREFEDPVPPPLPVNSGTGVGEGGGGGGIAAAAASIACTRSQLWASTECGVRFWEFSQVFGGHKGRKGGDEESAPFRESGRTSPTMSLVLDERRGLVWTGHKDGKIRSWKMNQDGGVGAEEEEGGSSFREGLSWHAHRSAVLSLILTSNGELWSGHESGVIKAWSWENIEKSLSLTIEERHMAALLIERSFIDLRNLVTVEGVCPLPSVNVKYMLSDNSKSKVWSGGSQSFALWDSQKKELLKVFGINGQVETQVDPSSIHDSYNDDDMKVKLIPSSKKEKSQGSGGFLQRSRNALLGAADAVRRVAAKGAFLEDNRKITALTMSVDGIIWIGCTNGSLIQWDGNGNRLQEFQHRSASVLCICTYGARIWVGYANGNVQVMDLEANLIGGWVAHSNPVVRMAVGGSYIFTLANHGGIRGWYLASPGPIDNILRSELTNKEQLYSKQENFKVLAGTWNVGQERASRDSLVTWLAPAASDVGLVVVGLQEIEMGAGFLAMAAAKESVGLEGSVNGIWWLDSIGKALDEGFERIGSRQLAGLLIGVWARKNLRPHIGDVDAAAVPCGLGRAIGNKGGVGVRIRVFDRTICFVNCHLAAHLEAVNKRNADFDHIYRLMNFGRYYAPGDAHGSGGASSIQCHRSSNATDSGKPELSEADMIVFLGDFNYRLRGITYDEARDLVSQRCFDWLREKDQLRAEMKAGKVFQGLREAHIKFPPTYKFDRYQAGLSGYDSGEKKRIPAWCDRVLYRDNRSVPVAKCSLECPIISCITHYDACLEVMGSDHKPVRCIFTVDVARVDELIRRQQFGEIVSSNEKARVLLEEFLNVPETIVSTNEILLTMLETFSLKITNKCSKDAASFEITCEVKSSFKDKNNSAEVPSKSPFGFPIWLKVLPASGIIKPGQSVDVALNLEDFNALGEFIDGASPNCWAEDTRDQEAILTVNITGSWCTGKKCHQIRVLQSSTSKNPCTESNRTLTRNQSKCR
ncbi:type I inositol polyphosphate 5-phosphatase 12-like [Asparagus officinalis]|uniref:type I inositol polyphosphate 5-phosphatase 12-like n=1 Tax=Asparagus officinalis TaxID=4686 RepID=UPI00098DEFF6|nr:type I inositol polyphosphate 5-phosphatase 12-like [Asparagus officinalis]